MKTVEQINRHCLKLKIMKGNTGTDVYKYFNSKFLHKIGIRIYFYLKNV